MDFADGEFDFLWCRHLLEQVTPLFTLGEFRRGTKPDGSVYVEPPAPDISACHENNPSHYSVFPASLGSLCFPAWDLRWTATSPSTSR